jgi:hypothetical protein
MSFSGRTPEALLPRSDSRNPATTCRGITSTGRPCRRPLAASGTHSTSPAPSPSRGNGVLAVLDNANAAAFYCWQHKDQAEQLAAQGGHTRLHPLKERSSIDSLVEQVGVLDLDENLPEKRRRHRHQSTGVKRRDTLPQGWNSMESPLMTVPEEILRDRNPKRRPVRPPPRSNVKFSLACCIQADEDDLPPARVRRDDRPRTSRSHTRPSPSSNPARTEMRQSSTSTPMRPKPVSAQSPTQALLSIIPSNLSPQTTSALLAELSRPISVADEAGYIYIFWLTPESEVAKPDEDTASSLLDGDEEIHIQRRTQALARYASVRRPNARSREQRTITLKIGRAANVHRRMTQWTKQCGQNITLIRYYPHTSTNSSTGTANPGSSAKVAHVHKVERLIHLELADKRVVKSDCPQCGREHREWFEIEATREGLRSVDEVVRRWTSWANRQPLPVQPTQQSQYY